MESFAEIIARWPSATALAADLKARGLLVRPVTVRSWRGHGIPGPYWDHVCEAAKDRGFNGVTRDLLCRLGRATRTAKQQSDG